MVKVFLAGHNYEYEIKELLKLFYSIEDICFIHNTSDSMDILKKQYTEDIIVNNLMIKDDIITISTGVNLNGNIKNTTDTIPVDDKDNNINKKIKTLIKSSIFKLLQEEKNKYVPWGILTGIRPVKIVHELMEKDIGDTEIIHQLMFEKFVTKEKALLLLEVAKRERHYIYPIDEKKVSLYISIPFCPTRCIYCSFPSNPIDKYSSYINDYLTALCMEIKGTGKLLREKNKEIESIYIGGGTPTTLNIDEFDILFNTIFNSFDISSVKEFTVEAGRPDTINMDKLRYLKKMGITRISINPQSMNDSTLERIGRNHSVQDIMDAYKIAQEVGFKNINMDLILGLPGEDVDMVTHTMEEIKKLSPNNLTVHTLAIKRSSQLKKEGSINHDPNLEIVKMLEVSNKYSRAMGLQPYYMYRQKHMVGNLENIGYCLPGHECIYNIQIMAERQSIIAMGAGAVSKIVFPKENRLERVPNVKNLEQYIERADEMVERKRNQLL